MNQLKTEAVTSTNIGSEGYGELELDGGKIKRLEIDGNGNVMAIVCARMRPVQYKYSLVSRRCGSNFRLTYQNRV